MFMNVDFPDPDGPMMATKLPRSMVVDTPRKACTSTSPEAVDLDQVLDPDEFGAHGRSPRIRPGVCRQG